MPVPNLDFDLSEDERQIKDVAHRFAVEVLRPAGQALDKLTPDEVIAPDSIFWDVFNQYQRLGFNDMDAEMDPVAVARLRCIISEELGWGDSGLAVALSTAGMPALLATMVANTELMERFPANDLGCWAITEPNHGSDMIDFNNRELVAGSEHSKPNCIARGEGDEFVISGQKSAWVSNGPIARSAALYCATETADGLRGGGIFLVPLDLEGITRGQPLKKIGQRALSQGEIFFDQVRIPASNMICGPNDYGLFTDMTLCMANGGMGMIFVGTARAAFDLALEYARERVQGGVPIIQHQSVKARLFTMYRKVEAARALSRRVSLYNAASEMPALEAAIAAKITSTQTAFDVASDALQIFGGAGTSQEYPIEKIFRDARVSMVEDGCNEVLALVGTDRLA
ncbi:MAG: acyl-CoA/acyl-ACP dehydrogenase [Proteobacteria bacterium]|nr:acyl-CoA/acyl-ACP dehydrogenase [Pseudomonadota bacterium]